MIAKLVGWCIDNRFLVMILTAIFTVIGLWATYTIPVDAIPDFVGCPGHHLHAVAGSRSADDGRPGNLSAGSQDALGARRIGCARLQFLRVLVRVRHFRGRYRHVLGTQPRAGVHERSTG